MICMHAPSYLSPVSKVVEAKHVAVTVGCLCIPVLNEAAVVMKDSSAVLILFT